MYRNSRGGIPANTKRSYMKALRDLLGLNQYTTLRLMDDARIIRESEVSAIEGKIGYSHLWEVYASFFDSLIEEEKDHTEKVKEIMRELLKTWRES